MLILSKELQEKGKILLFDAWSPTAECRLDFYERDPNLLGEVWICTTPGGYDCRVRWYYRPGILRFLLGLRKYVSKESTEHFFSGRGGGALKALIRATNLYFSREDDVDDEINITSLDEW